MHAAQQYFSQAKARSKENQEAFALLHAKQLFGVCIGLLRQELDTLVNLCYLEHHDSTHAEAVRLMEQSAKGKKWEKVSAKGKYSRITDREMVNLASRLGGWEKLIYDFGCKLVHLSNFHIYQTNDPVASLPIEERERLIEYLKSYHSYPKTSISMQDVADYLPEVMAKLSRNVESCIKRLEGRFLGSATQPVGRGDSQE